MTAPPSADTLVSVGLALPPWALASALWAILARISVETFRPWNEDNANQEATETAAEDPNPAAMGISLSMEIDNGFCKIPNSEIKWPK